MIYWTPVLWKLLLRTLIRYRDHTDQETAPWRLYCTVKARPNGSNIVESNMLHSFGHHVARCCMMLDDVERSLISIKHRLIIQHFFCS